MNENVFKRVEQKYILNKEQRDNFLDKINEFVEKDPYFESKICNIYFDNNENDLMVNSLEKPEFKAKVRLRSYDVPNMDSQVFLEVKDKYKGVVGKRRIKLSLKEFYDYYENGLVKDNQIMKELNYYFKMFDLKPFIFLAYDRNSYYEKGNRNLRITLDSNLRSRYNDLRLELGDNGKKYFDEDTYIMEIKVMNAMPLWLTRILSELKIYPTSFSKVGSIYSKEKESECLC